jgi:hypothetical protein
VSTEAKRRAITRFRSSLAPVLLHRGFARKGMKFVRTAEDVVQTVGFRSFMSLEDRFFIRWSMELVGNDRAGQPFSRQLQFLEFSESFDSVMMAPYGLDEIAAAVEWHTYWLNKRVLAVADRLIDSTEAFKYNDFAQALETDSVNLIVR